MATKNTLNTKASAAELDILDGATLDTTELNYVDGVTSAIQTQLNAKSPSVSPTFTGTVILPKTLEIQDTSADHQYVLAVSELAADRTVTLPLLGGADEFVFKDHAVTLTNKTLTAPVMTAPVLGTPASGTLTNATGLPLTGLVSDTTTALGIGSINLGHASDTTITRVSAGVVAVEGVNVLLSGGALGTPSSGTLTNASGLPLTGLVSDTTTALGIGSINLGHASDTTLARVSAGVVSVEGVTLLTTATGQPLDTQLTSLAGLSYAGNSLKVVRVNAGETDFELSSAGSGDVVGPASSVDNQVVRFDSTTGKLIQTSGVTIDDTNNIYFPAEGVGTPITYWIKATDQTNANKNGNPIKMWSGAGNGTGAGGTFTLAGGAGGATDGAGGYLNLSAGDGVGTGSGGDLYFQPGTSPSGTAGKIRFTDAVNGFDVVFDLSNISTEKTISFPNSSTTLMGLSTVQTITGAKTFGSAGAVGKLIVAGNTSGTTILNAAATAGSTTMTFPGTSGTVAILDIAQTFTADQSVPDEVYGVGWNGSVEVPTKNAIYDKIETMSGGNVSNTGTPVNNQIAVWTSATVIEGVTGLTFDDASVTLTNSTSAAGYKLVGSSNPLNGVSNGTYTLDFGLATAAGSFSNIAQAGDGIVRVQNAASNGSLILSSQNATGSVILATGTGPGTDAARLTIANAGAATFSSSATATAFIPSSSTIPTNGLYLPAANTLGWAINSAAELQLTGTALSPAADGGSSLGTTALGWQNLFGNTGFVANIENGDWVATHTAGILTVGTGDLRVTNNFTNATSVVTLGGAQTLTNKTLTSPTLTTPSAFTTGGTITLAENTSIALDPAGSADGKYSGITVTGTGGATIAFGDLVCLSAVDSRWEIVDISVAAAAIGDARRIIGIAVTSSTDGGAITILLNGTIRADANFPALTIGAAVYASTTGDIVVTQPVTVDHVIRVVGYALTADEIYFNPENDWITHT